MEYTEHIAGFLRFNGFPDATNGIMPPEPHRNVCVLATGMRQKSEDEGSRFQVLIRSEPNNDTALGDSMRVLELLEDFSGITSIDSPYFHRISVESGATNLGADALGRLLYSINFRVWYCE